ncbi:MAG: adenosylcobinamide-phosphate synthase CbiB [Spirochaetaceae bacterium]|jgi:adenosylcobinamide-phosphate synthase|nr:adenosylcobinamide-phosphate synthase CbiB [Spirochaetaceae bacterium]
MPLFLPCGGAALLIAAFTLDAALGDPPWFPHPVRGIGILVERGEPLFRRIFCGKACTPARERAAGTALAVSVCAVIFIFFYAVIDLALRFGRLPCFIVSLTTAYLAISARCLRDEAIKVYRKVEADDLAGARQALSMIVGRDTGTLSMEKVIKATVETVAENLADGVIAPLFYLALGGPALAMLYKAVNTMDSMIGYKNERYLNFGRFAAKLDDALGWIPARIAACLMIVSAAALRLDAKNALRVYKRDRFNHASPNSAHCEAACAGALGLTLGGDAFYDGKLEQKPPIGDGTRRAEKADIVNSVHLMYGAAVLFVILAGALLAAPRAAVCGILWK